LRCGLIRETQYCHMKLDILAFGAHPDDVELCVGGTVVKHIGLGYKVGIVDFTRGEMGTRGTPELRIQEAGNAAKVLGVSVRENLEMRDGFIEVTEENLHKIIRVVRKYRPDVVLANTVKDRHPDHVMASQLSARGCFLAGLAKIATEDDGKPQDPWRPKAIYNYIQNDHLVPDICVDVTATFEKKMEAIRCYKSQFYDPDSEEPQTPISTKDFFDYLAGIAKVYGRLIGAEYAEGYTVNREMGVRDLLKLD